MNAGSETTGVTDAEPADAPYWRGLREGRLLMQRCQGCQRWKWPAVARCGDCGAWHPPWQSVAMRGVLYSWIKTWQAFASGEDCRLPYVTVLVALPEAGGRRLLGLFEGDEAQLGFDAPLQGRVTVTRVAGAQIPSIRWRPA